MSLPKEWNLQASQMFLDHSARPQSIISDDFEIQQKYNDKFFDIAFNPEDKCRSHLSKLLAEYDNSGSLFSIQSAPVTTSEAENTETATNSTNNIPKDSVLRPSSLAFETPYIPSKLPNVQAQLSVDLDEDDNENLLTISSLTARPLIAKSRELKSKRDILKAKREKAQEFRQRLDGGYGWIIVFGAFSVQFWVAGLVKSYGVFYVEIMENFSNSSAFLGSWIPAILSALCLALAPVSSALSQKYSCRIVVIIGGLFCCLGLTLSYFATSLIHLLFTFGILTGIGGGLSTTPGIIIVSTYFEKRRALANGICISGTAAGSFVFPILIEKLIKSFGFHGTILILGCCMLHVCLSGALYRPIQPEDTIPKKSSCSNIKEYAHPLSSSEDHLSKRCLEQLFIEETLNDKNSNSLNFDNKLVNVTEKQLQESEDELKDIIGNLSFLKPFASLRSSSILHSVEDLSTDSTFVYRNRSGYDSNRNSKRYKQKPDETEPKTKDIMEPERNDSLKTVPINKGLSKSMIIPTPVYDLSDLIEEEYRKKSLVGKIKQYLDISLLKEVDFILMCCSVTLMSVGCPYMLYYLPAYILSIGYIKPEAGYLVAVSAAFDLCGRLSLGYLSDLQLFDRKKAYVFCILGAGIAVLLIPMTNSWMVIVGCAGCYGLCLGSWYLLVPVLLNDLFGTYRISSSYGLVRLFQSIGAISIPPLAGFLSDLTGGYEICFYCMGTAMILGALPLIYIIVRNSLEGDNKDAEVQ